ncbi:FAD-dependent monooxygenase [Nocardia sp. NPDC052316]|uniref:FAD-dependent monooxygenase n=1 Tax=Nocardia sp. NPDC052316 TaxID=3364329 RepID=UPI0037CC0658
MRTADPTVLVIGAGPTGLMLAGELRLAGTEVLVVESLIEPTGESRGLGFNARTMEVFDQRDLLSRFGVLATNRYGHFGGVPLDFGLLDGPHFGTHGAQGIPQAQTEAVLESWARDLGARIWRGATLIALRQDSDEVVATIAGQDATVEVVADYLVGCDGGRSTVRRLAEYEFPGTAATLEMMLADLRGCEIAGRPFGEHVPGGMVMSGHLGGGVYRIILHERGARPRASGDAPSFDEVAAAWQRLTGQDISAAQPLWTSAFGNATRQVTQYRRGRILLAGDAAHIHLPAGGQGLNVGIQDAVNLGWKLGLVAGGHASDDLLDTYHHERHPVGAKVLQNTRAQGFLMLGGPTAEPVRELLRELAGFDEVARHLAGAVAGVDARYDMGRGEHPLLGRRLPQQDLRIGGESTSTTVLLRSARGVLIDLGSGRACAEAAGWTDRVDLVAARPDPSGVHEELTGLEAVLLRPDGHVAWLRHRDGDTGPLTEALSTWFGADAELLTHERNIR